MRIALAVAASLTLSSCAQQAGPPAASSASPLSSQAPASSAALDEDKPIPAKEGWRHVGEIATVCGKLYVAYRPDIRLRPTFLDLEAPYPHQAFQGRILDTDRAKLAKAQKTMIGKRVCITGKIEMYQGHADPVAEILVRDRSQLRLAKQSDLLSAR